MNEKYNGWTNWETWMTALWMENDQGEYNYWLEVSRSCSDAHELSEIIKEQFDYIIETHVPNTGWLCDLVYGTFNTINFYEIAEHWI